MHSTIAPKSSSNCRFRSLPLQGWALPAEFAELRRQMEARLGKRGRREYVQVLRLLETFSMDEVSAAIRRRDEPGIEISLFRPDRGSLGK